MQLPRYVMDVLDVLSRAGFTAYVVGGAVRNWLMGLTPYDYDIVTDARPEQVIKVFEDAGWKVVPKGINYGVVSVVHPDGPEIEIATMRRELYPMDYRRRAVIVEYTRSIEEDLHRRDFTVNAIAYSPEFGFVDLFGGRDDIRRGILRFIGEPRKRIREDPLRMLRALRFASQLGFSIHPDTFEAIREEADKLSFVSGERIGEEIVKIMKGEKPYLFPRLLYESKLYKIVLPELGLMKETSHDYRYSHYGEDVLQHTEDVMSRLSSVTRKWKLRLATMLHDIGKPFTVQEEKGKIMFPKHDVVGAKIAKQRMVTTWRRPGIEANYVVRIVEQHMKPLFISQSLSGEALAKRLVARYGSIAFDLALHAYADTGDEYWLEIAKIINIKQQSSIKPLVTGHDIIALGVEPGPIIRELKKKALELQLSGLTKKEILEELSAEIQKLKSQQRRGPA